MRNSLRLQRLTELKYVMDNHDKLFKKVVFDIGSWAYLKDRKSERKYVENKYKDLNCDIAKKVGCGTAACALGSAAMYEPFVKKGLKIKSQYDGWASGSEWLDFEPSYKGHTGTDAGTAFFGITEKEASYLFMPDAYHEPENYFGEMRFSDALKKGLTKAVRTVKPKHVSERIQKLIDSYKKDEQPFLENDPE